LREVKKARPVSNFSPSTPDSTVRRPSHLSVRARRTSDAEKTEIKFWRWPLRLQECKTGYGGAYGAVLQSLRFASLESSGRLSVAAFGKNLASVAVTKFTHLTYFTKKCYTLCIFNVNCKDNAAINCVTAQDKTGSFPNHTTIVYFIMILKIMLRRWGKSDKATKNGCSQTIEM
jgi:hypothetical protein